MCYYIALVVQGSDAATIDGVLRPHGRQAKPFGNESIRGALVPGEAQFLTTVGHCDCGTALAPTIIDRASKRTSRPRSSQERAGLKRRSTAGLTTA